MLHERNKQTSHGVQNYLKVCGVLAKCYVKLCSLGMNSDVWLEMLIQVSKSYLSTFKCVLKIIYLITCDSSYLQSKSHQLHTLHVSTYFYAARLSPVFYVDF